MNQDGTDITLVIDIHQDIKDMLGKITFGIDNFLRRAKT